MIIKLSFSWQIKLFSVYMLLWDLSHAESLKNKSFLLNVVDCAILHVTKEALYNNGSRDGKRVRKNIKT